MFFLVILLTTIVVGVFLIHLFLTWNNDYFEKRGIPHLKPSPIFGNMTDVVFKKKAMADVVQQAYELNPEARYVGFYDFSSPVILLKDPELVKSITIKNFDSFPDHKFFTESKSEALFQKNLIALRGDEWRNMRSLLSPAFTSSKMKMMFKILSQCAIDFSECLEKLDPQPEEIDMKETFGRYTLDVIASSAFGLTVNSMKDRNNDFYRMGKEVSDFSGIKMLKFFIMRSCHWLTRLLNLKLIDSVTSDYFINVIESTIAERDEKGIVRPDMIHLMMQARDRNEKSPLSSEDMAAQAFIFLLGGFDSPASTMSFAANALALNRDVQRKLQREIDKVLEKSIDNQVSYEDLHAMKYLDAVVNETLRIFPPGAVMDRVGPKSFTLPPALPGLEPLEIKPGVNIWIPLYSFHHDEKYFKNPEKFDPERFNDDNKSNINPMTYFPFGLGPRICIANRFALMEVKLALFYLLSKCDLLTTDKTQSTLKLSPDSFLMMPLGGFWLKIQPRNLNTNNLSL